MTAPAGDAAAAVRRYLDAVRSSAERDLGRRAAGTEVVGAADRAGSSSAVCYPCGDVTIVWCAPEAVDRLRPLDRDDALTHEAFVDEAARLGAGPPTGGRNLVLGPEARSAAIQRTVRSATAPLAIDRDDPADVALLAAFVEACDADDLDEAELDLDDLDPAIVANDLPDAPGTLAAVAYARPWDLDGGFDDIGVIGHPAHRGHGLAAAAVRALIARPGGDEREPLYRHDLANDASARVADALGFTPAQTLAAVDITSIPT